MPSIKLQLTDEEMKEIAEIWKINKERLRKDVRKKIGWNALEDFLADILRFGLDKASDDPVTFIKTLREERDPLFVKEKKEHSVKRVRQDWSKGYA